MNEQLIRMKIQEWGRSLIEDYGDDRDIDGSALEVGMPTHIFLSRLEGLVKILSDEPATGYGIEPWLHRDEPASEKTDEDVCRWLKCDGGWLTSCGRGRSRHPNEGDRCNVCGKSIRVEPASEEE